MSEFDFFFSVKKVLTSFFSSVFFGFWFDDRVDTVLFHVQFFFSSVVILLTLPFFFEICIIDLLYFKF